MAHAIRCCRGVHCTAPIRVDHVPAMAGEQNGRPGYGTVGRLCAIGYLRGLMEASGYELLRRQPRAQISSACDGNGENFYVLEGAVIIIWLRLL